MRLILLMMLATAMSPAPGRAQLFPFSSLHSYFKSVAAGGPGADADPEEPSAEAKGAEPQAAAAEAPPSRQLRPPPNHRLHEEEALGAEAAPVVGLLRPAPYPSQVLQPPPSRAPALDYAAHRAAAPSPAPFVPTLLPAPAPAPAVFTPAQPTLVLAPPPSSAAFVVVPTPAPRAPPKAAVNHKPSTPTAYPKKFRPENHGHEKSSTGEYPKKYHPENHNHEKVVIPIVVGTPKIQRPDNHNHEHAQASAAENPPQKVHHDNHNHGKAASPKKKHAPPKKASASDLSKEQLQFKQQQRQSQQVAATVEAASFQRPARPSEQEAAESGFAEVAAGAGLGSSDRVEFQMHGQHGPHSYKWGYDTGKGHNRQFRYEERDAHGHVKGHYGFYDKHGKLQVVSYSADPEHGYHADGNFGKHSIA